MTTPPNPDPESTLPTTSQKTQLILNFETIFKRTFLYYLGSFLVIVNLYLLVPRIIGLIPPYFPGELPFLFTNGIFFTYAASPFLLFPPLILGALLTDYLAAGVIAVASQPNASWDTFHHSLRRHGHHTLILGLIPTAITIIQLVIAPYLIIMIQATPQPWIIILPLLMGLIPFFFSYSSIYLITQNCSIPQALRHSLRLFQRKPRITLLTAILVFALQFLVPGFTWGPSGSRGGSQPPYPALPINPQLAVFGLLYVWGVSVVGTSLLAIMITLVHHDHLTEEINALA